MTKEEAAHLSDVLKAYSEGKEIEHLRTDGVWDCICKDPIFTEGPMRYRIKPEPKYRPYANAEEFLKAQKEHGPYMFANFKYFLPLSLRDNKVMFQDEKDSELVRFDELVYVQWQDGTPCGIVTD